MSTPGRVIEKIHEAVQEAIANDVDPRTFVSEVWQSWSDVLDDKRRLDAKAFDDILKGK